MLPADSARYRNCKHRVFEVGSFTENFGRRRGQNRRLRRVLLRDGIFLFNNDGRATDRLSRNCSISRGVSFSPTGTGDFGTMGIKLSAKFARQESEQARLARIARKRIPPDRIETIRRMLGILDPECQVLKGRRGGS